MNDLQRRVGKVQQSTILMPKVDQANEQKSEKQNTLMHY